jgi:PBP1b-binding outer membrane lipoprotein LpoB
MKSLVYICFFATIIFSCTSAPKNNKQTINNLNSTKSAKQTNQQNISDTTVIDPNTLGCLVTHYSYGYDPEQFSPGTFNKTTYIYNSTKPGAKIIDTLPFNTSVNILKAYSGFYLVCTPKAKSGYIKKTDVYSNKMFGSSLQSENYHYLIGITKYAKEADTYEGSILKFIK